MPRRSLRQSSAEEEEPVRQAWLPAQFTDVASLPPHLHYECWDGAAAYPSDPATVEFYVPPLTQDVATISRPLPRMTRLAAVQALSSGVDELLPVVGTLGPDVCLCSARGVHAESTAELALSLMLASLRGLADFARAQDLCDWRSGEHHSLHGQAVLIVGYGAVGSALEELLVPFGCAVTRTARYARRTAHGPVRPVSGLLELLPGADVVVLATELNQATRQLADGQFLARMKDGALLVNVSRGAVVDTDALLGALRAGRIRAALDVTDPEPLPAGHPLWSAPGVLITPHVGAFTHRMWPRLEALIRRQVWRFARGEPLLNVVHPQLT